jgi:diketogulonate reductase-like aldo/keto reductase
VGGLARSRALAEVAHARAGDATPPELALAWLLGLSPDLVAIPGARRPETARSVARAATLTLDPADRQVLARAYGAPRTARRERPRGTEGEDAVLVMGIPGAGKSRVAQALVARGYVAF